MILQLYIYVVALLSISLLFNISFHVTSETDSQNNDNEDMMMKSQKTAICHQNIDCGCGFCSYFIANHYILLLNVMCLILIQFYQ